MYAIQLYTLSTHKCHSGGCSARVIPPSANIVTIALAYAVLTLYPCCTRAQERVKIARYFVHALVKSYHAKQDLERAIHDLEYLTTRGCGQTKYNTLSLPGAFRPVGLHAVTYDRPGSPPEKYVTMEK